MPIGNYPFANILPDNYIFMSQGYKTVRRAAINFGLLSRYVTKQVSILNVSSTTILIKKQCSI